MSLKIKESSTCVEKHSCTAIAGFIVFSWVVLLGPVVHAKFGYGVDRQNPDPPKLTEDIRKALQPQPD